MLDWDLLDEPPIAPTIPFPALDRAPVLESPAEPEALPDVVTRARQMADGQLTRLLGVAPDDLQRIAAQAEVYLSTIRSYLDALGSGLELHIAGVGAVDVATVLGVDPAAWGKVAP